MQVRRVDEAPGGQAEVRVVRDFDAGPVQRADLAGRQALQRVVAHRLREPGGVQHTARIDALVFERTRDRQRVAGDHARLVGGDGG
mgnify:CR=1 FL=1